MSAQTEPDSTPPSPEPAPTARLSIGEVVALLRPEFSDLTDSKIRFLEDRKLISPARTPGGYRSFGPHDVEVLRWILTRQRDQYLPLSIIGERIDRGEHLADIWGIGLDGPDKFPNSASAVSGPESSDAHAATEEREQPTVGAVEEAGFSDQGAADRDAGGAPEVGEVTADRSASSRESSERAGDPAAAATAGSTGPPWLAEGGTRTYTAAELSADSGLTLDDIAELTGFGLLVPLDGIGSAGSPTWAFETVRSEDPGAELAQPVRSASAAAQPDPVQASLGLEPPEPRYGSGALLIARICREFSTYGLQARHLRVIRNAAARDAAMFEQGIQPVIHAGGATADEDAQRSLGRLVALCERLRAQVMGEALRHYWD